MVALNLAVVLFVVAISVLLIAVQGVKIAGLKQKLSDAVVGTEKRNIQLSYLIKSSQNLSSALNKEKLLRLIVEAFGEITKSDRMSGLCALYLMDYAINRYVYTTGFNMDVTMLAKPSFSINDTPFKMLKKSKEIVFFDEQDSIKTTFFKGSKLGTLQDIDFAIFIPLTVENESIGVALAFLPESSFNFLKKDIHLLQALAGQVSIALGSAVQSELAVLDRLTKVYNHAYFEGRLEQEIARSDRYKYPVSVLMIDIDHFKGVNDTYGHQQGDELLKAVAHVIRSNIRIVDLCARYGGEEFVVILPETDLTAGSKKDAKSNLEEAGGALAKGERLRKAIADISVVTSNGQTIKVTASIGVGVKRFPEGASLTKEQLITKADQQLYRAKREGRNRVCYA